MHATPKFNIYPSISSRKRFGDCDHSVLDGSLKSVPRDVIEKCILNAIDVSRRYTHQEIRYASCSAGDESFASWRPDCLWNNSATNQNANRRQRMAKMENIYSLLQISYSEQDRCAMCIFASSIRIHCPTAWLCSNLIEFRNSHMP